MRGKPDYTSYCAFGRYLVDLCDARGVKVMSLAPNAGGTTRLSYALRGRLAAPGRRCFFDYATLTTLADTLCCNKGERQTLVMLGMLEHGPQELRSCVLTLIAEQKRLSTLAKCSPRPLDFSGRDRTTPLS
jgi:hypothetical protein